MLTPQEIARRGTALAVIAFLSPAFCGTLGADWKERLRTEAPPRWAALHEYYSQVDVSYRKIISTPSEGKPFSWSFVGSIHTDIRKNGEMAVRVSHRVGKDRDGKTEDATQVEGVNSRYTFKLLKTTPSAAEFILANHEPATNDTRRKFKDKLMNDFDMIFMVQGWRLADILKDPQFTINAHGLRRNGKEVVQLEYIHQSKTDDSQSATAKQAAPVEQGTIILDPASSWRVLESSFDNLNWKGTVFMEYGDEVDGFPIPRRARFTATSKKGYGNQLITFEFDKFAHVASPESEFMLSAFGLPEMQLPGEQQPRTLWRWLMGIGLALGVLAVLARVYVKKKRHLPQNT